MAARKSSPARFSFIALIVAAIGLLATAGFLLMRAAVALALYTPARPETLTQGLAISAGVLLIGLALYGILNPPAVRRFLTGRHARYGSNAFVLSTAFIGILVIVNWLVYQNPKRFDLSEGKQHTLAPETLQALEALPSNVHAKAFYSSQYPTETARSLLDNLKSNSKGRFDFEFVDPNADPVQARQFGITGDGKIVLIMGASREIASYADENTITQAMIRLISPENRVVYFLTGHGEPDLQDSDTSSMLRAKQTLESKNYQVEELSLATTHRVPDDAKAVIVAGPAHPLLQQEVDLLESYLQSGGALVLLADPPTFTEVETADDPLAAYLEATWSITLQDTLVIDLSSNQPFTAISATYSATAPITSRTTSFTLMPEARSLGLPETPPENLTVTALILTSQQSWGETDLQALESGEDVRFDEGSDIPGPLTVAASAEDTKTHGRVVVFGNSVFARNEGFDHYANGDVFTNAVDWAAEQDDIINITPRTPVSRVFNPPSQLGFILILLMSLFVLPGLVLLAGISSWLARRRRG